MKATFTVDIDIYDTQVKVYLLEDTEVVSLEVKKLLRQNKVSVKGVPRYLHGYCLWTMLNPKLYNLLYSIDELTYNTVAHEVWHATNYILQFNNIVENENREAGACLNGYLIDRIITEIQGRDIEINKNGSK